MLKYNNLQNTIEHIKQYTMSIHFIEKCTALTLYAAGPCELHKLQGGTLMAHIL